MDSNILVAFLCACITRLAQGTAVDLSRQHGQCHMLLHALAKDDHGDFDFHIACRARFPTNLCRDALETLGQQPWLPDKIDKTCHGLAGLVQARTAMMSPERQAMTYEGLQQTMDLCAKTKAQYGIHIPKDKDGHVDLDGALKAKLRETKKITQKLNEYWRKHFEGARIHRQEDVWKPQQEWDTDPVRESVPVGPASTIPSMIIAGVVGATLTLITQRVWSSAAKSWHIGAIIADHEDRRMRFGVLDSELEMQQ